jgi:hypothetical protein
MRRRVLPLLLAALTVAVAPGPVSADTPTPAIGPAWSQDQPITYRWSTGEVPDSWLQPLVHAAAADVNNSRASRSPTFSFSSTGMGTVAYNAGPLCGADALACMRRYPTTSFLVQVRKQGQRVGWGTIRWCHAYATWPTGCFDAELSLEHEFGHVAILDHSYTDRYPDSIMTPVQAANPISGWNQHTLGRCDVARLQMAYDVATWSAPYSTCLTIPTVSAITASPTTVPAGTPLMFGALVRTVNSTAYGRLADNPLHARTVVIQRAAIGGSSWIDVTTMTPSSAAGVYFRSIVINASYQWRVSFRPSGEGVLPSNSAPMIVRIG